MKRNTHLFHLVYCVLILFLASCKKELGYGPERIKSDLITVSSNAGEDEEINAFIAPYKNAIQSEMDSVLAYAPNSYNKNDGDYNTAIGNMMADAVWEMANPIFEKRAGYPFSAVLLNHGGIRAPINKGPITTRTGYEIMPFENEVVVVELSSTQIKKMFLYLEQGKAHPISNMEIILDASGKLKTTKIQGQDIIDGETYFIATNDYLLNGGDGMDFFNKPVSVLPLDYKLRNLFIDYFKKYDTIAPVRDHRFTKKEL